MAFCKYSSSQINSDTITIDVKFLNDYIAVAPENCLKVYLFGLLKCKNSAGSDNTIENFENVLGLSKEDVIDCFLYWQDQNVVQVLDTEPIEIRYLPTKDNIKNTKKIESKKYASFVQELQEILSGRQITPNEFYKYIDFVEHYNILPCDFIMIVKYCADIKGNNINSNYILTVAKVWAEEGVKTASKIEEKIENLTLISSDASKIAKALSYKGNLSIEHQQLCQKWINSYGFNLNNLLLVAKKVASKTKSYSFETLDRYLTKYYELKLMSFAEIEEYEANKNDLKNIAREINKALGVYYESVDNEIETYILPWMTKGFNQASLIQIANFCFKNSIRNLEGMDESIQKFHKLGLTSINSINNYLAEILQMDSKIKEILARLKIDRRVNSFDRSFYRTWTYSYNFSDEIIDFAVSLAENKSNSMRYVNTILTNWFEKKYTMLEQVKNDQQFKKQSKEKSFVGKSFGDNFTEEEVNALFDNLDEINL